jgi:hypothetical protein
MARHKSPNVKKYWPLLKEMQRLINNGARPHAAALKLAKKHWRALSKTEDACVHRFEYNQRKFLDELDPVFAERTAMVKWAKNLDPPAQALEDRNRQKPISGGAILRPSAEKSQIDGGAARRCRDRLHKKRSARAFSGLR